MRFGDFFRSRPIRLLKLDDELHNPRVALPIIQAETLRSLDRAVLRGQLNFRISGKPKRFFAPESRWIERLRFRTDNQKDARVLRGVNRPF